MKAHETKVFLANMDYVDDPVAFCNELQRVLDAYTNDSYFRFEDKASILGAFSWQETPQGFDYWNNIYCQIYAAGGERFQQE